MLSSDLPLIKPPSLSVGYFTIDVFILILTHLIPEQIAWLTTVNKQFSQLINHKQYDELWRAKRVQHFAGYPDDQNAIGHYSQFKKTYHEQYRNTPSILRRHFSMFVENDIRSLSSKALLNPFHYLQEARHDGNCMLKLAGSRNNQTSLDFIYAAFKKEFEIKNAYYATSTWDAKTVKMNNTLLSCCLACRQPLSEIQALIEQGSSFNESYTRGFRPIHIIAIWHNKIDVLEKLLEFYPEHLNLRNEGNETPIMLACLNGNDKLVEYFLKQPGIDLTNNAGLLNIMECAVRSGNIHSVRLLIEYDLTNQVFSEDIIFNACTEALKSFYSMKIVTILTEKYPLLLKKKNSKGQTILMSACSYGLAYVVEHLWEQGEVDLTVEDNTDKTALDYAISADHEKVITFILDKIKKDALDQKPEIMKMLFQSYLFAVKINKSLFAVRNKKLETVKLILQSYPGFLNQVNSAQSALSLACNNDDCEMIKYLLAQPDIDINVYIRTPNPINHLQSVFAWAGHHKHIDILKLLLQLTDSEVFLNSDACKKLPDIFCYAALNDNLDMMAAFVGHDQSYVDCTSSENKTALLLAASKGHINIINYLIAQNAALIERNDGTTAIHFAAHYDYSEIVDVLLNHYHAGLSFNKSLRMGSKLTLDVKGKLELIEYMSKQANYTSTTFGYTANQKKIVAQELRDLVFYKGPREDYMDLLNRFRQSHEYNLGTSTLGKIYLNLKAFLQKKMESLSYARSSSISYTNRK